MKKGQIYEGTAIDVNFPDKAVVLTKETDKNGIGNECHVEVKGVLPGQTVKYIVKKARAGKCKGRLLEVVKRSPSETEKPACANFGACGGCSYQTLPYQAQLELKKNQVLKLVNSVLEEGSYKFDGIFQSPCIWGYRNKMEFSFGDEYKGGPLSLGLHKKGSIHDIINASGCKIVNGDYTKVLDCIKKYFLNKNIPHYNKNTHMGILRHLLVRRSSSTGEILVALVTTSGIEDSAEKIPDGSVLDGDGLNKHCLKDCLSGNIPERDSLDVSGENSQISGEHGLNRLGLDQLGKELENLELEGSITGFIHIINDGLGDVVKSDETRIIFGKDWITEEILGLKFRISVFSFFQTNTKGAEVLYSCARNYILGKPAYGMEDNIKSMKEEIEETPGECKNRSIHNCGETDAGNIINLNIEKNVKGNIEGNVEKGELLAEEAKEKFQEERFHKEKFQEENFQDGIINGKLVSEVKGKNGEITREEINLKDKVVFDLYSGTGTIAQIIAPIAKKVTGVEIVEEAVEAAKQNAIYNGLGNCGFIAGDVLKVLDGISEKPDFIILDPPREGVNPKALKKIGGELKVPGMVYISCKPTSLVRDIVELQKYGYKVERVCCVDMFPQTGHVETVVKLTLKKDTPKIEVTMEPNANISNYKPKERVTYQKIKDYVKEQTGLNIHTSYIAQIKEKCGLNKQYTFEKEEGRRVAKCPPEKEAAIMDAFRHFGWI